MTDLVSTGQTSPSATLTCPACQQSITYYDITGSSFYACPHCHTFFNYEFDNTPEVLVQFPALSSAYILPVGTEGYLNGQFVRVVGFMHKKEASAPYEWVEYMLLQADGRTVQLAEYNGHWMLIEPTNDSYTPYQATGKTAYIYTAAGLYRLYNQYQSQVLNAVGEFDWNILEDQQLTIAEYIQPPFMLVNERDGSDSNWYKAHYVSREEIARAFGLAKNTLPPTNGVGAIEPADPENRAGTVLAFSALSVVVLIVLQLIVSITRHSQQLLNESYTTTSDTSGVVKPIISPSFRVEGPTALTFSLHADIDNQWLELPVTLISEQSGKNYEFTKSLEYYHGVEGGESWTEGGQDDDAVLTHIPSGKYHLLIYPASKPGQLIAFRVKVQQSNTLISNLLIMLGLLSIYPILLYWHRSSYEKQRWNNSDYVDEQET